ncbi:MAG: phosphotransferase, partial [Muribaculaceae bacterium]|nr:phosphotransferase [Muribaculaceae bacterium]
MDLTTISRLYAGIHGLAPAKVTELPSSGSNRRYFRLSEDEVSRSLIGVLGTSKEENDAFIYMARHF